VFLAGAPGKLKLKYMLYCLFKEFYNKINPRHLYITGIWIFLNIEAKFSTTQILDSENS
jgi:hypothetical protein